MFAAEKGCEVVIVDKSAEKVDKIRDEIVSKGGSAHSVPFNITNNSLVDQFSQLLDAAFPQVMYLFFNTDVSFYPFQMICNFHNMQGIDCLINIVPYMDESFLEQCIQKSISDSFHITR